MSWGDGGGLHWSQVETPGVQSAQRTLGLLPLFIFKLHRQFSNIISLHCSQKRLENKIFPFVSISVGILETPEPIALGDSRCPMGMLGQNKGLFYLLFNEIYISEIFVLMLMTSSV